MIKSEECKRRKGQNSPESSPLQVTKNENNKCGDSMATNLKLWGQTLVAKMVLGRRNCPLDNDSGPIVLVSRRVTGGRRQIWGGTTISLWGYGS